MPHPPNMCPTHLNYKPSPSSKKGGWRNATAYLLPRRLLSPSRCSYVKGYWAGSARDHPAEPSKGLDSLQFPKPSLSHSKPTYEPEEAVGSRGMKQHSAPHQGKGTTTASHFSSPFPTEINRWSPHLLFAYHVSHSKRWGGQANNDSLPKRWNCSCFNCL